jgi:hypothetical protein
LSSGTTIRWELLLAPIQDLGHSGDGHFDPPRSKVDDPPSDPDKNGSPSSVIAPGRNKLTDRAVVCQHRFSIEYTPIIVATLVSSPVIIFLVSLGARYPFD